MDGQLKLILITTDEQLASCYSSTIQPCYKVSQSSVSHYSYKGLLNFLNFYLNKIELLVFNNLVLLAMLSFSMKEKYGLAELTLN